MATQLGLYNASLKILGEPKLASLSEAREPRYALDDVYSEVTLFCLEEGQWWFARREASISADATAPSFGYQYRFAKPTDWVRTMAMSANEFFNDALLDMSDQPAWWYANVNPLYVAYVSNDATSYGMLLSQWPATFARYVEYELAYRICMQITHGRIDEAEVGKKRDRAKNDALNKDAMNDTAKILPHGSIVRSRYVGGANNIAGIWRNGIYYR